MALSLGEKLRTLRKGKKLTLDGLAETVGISKSYLWELENRTQAKPSAEILDKLAGELGVPIGYLLDESAALPGRIIWTRRFSGTTRSLAHRKKNSYVGSSTHSGSPK